MIRMVKISFNAMCNQKCLNVPCTTEEILRMCIQKCVNDVLVEMQSVAKMHNIQFMVAGKCREKKTVCIQNTCCYQLFHSLWITRDLKYTPCRCHSIPHIYVCAHCTVHIYLCVFFIKTIRLFNGKLFISDKSLLNSVAQ